MSGTTFKRAHGRALIQTAMQAGMATPAEAEHALMVGARMQAHGFTDADIDRMIQNHYRDAANREAARA